MIKLEPFRIQFMEDNCYLVCFSAHAGGYYEKKVDVELAENNHGIDFEIMVKRQDSIKIVIEEAKRKIKEIMPLLTCD